VRYAFTAFIRDLFSYEGFQVSVGGMKDGQYYSGVITVTRNDDEVCVWICLNRGLT
jgi:hypothetical protein